MEKTILFWWLFVPASEPGNLKISCMASFLTTATSFLAQLSGAAQLPHAHLSCVHIFNGDTFLLTTTVLICFVFKQNEFFNVCFESNTDCFFPRRVTQQLFLSIYSSLKSDNLPPLTTCVN